ncbi:MAG: Patatin-like phospholipase [Deltaproteobacteria bacterium]|nr:Patatin-like phospholipase [Deltaproteobacteria bacterium]
MAECASFATAILQRALACEPPGARGGRRPSRGTPAPRGSGPRSCSRAAARAGPTRCACCGVCSTSVCCGATRACCARSRSRPRTSIQRTVSSSWTRAPTCRSGSAGASASSARASASNEHPMASSAIPVFFPSVEIEGRHFGDGSIRASRSAESTCCGSRHRAGSRRSPRKSPTPSRPWSATAPASERLREPVPGSGE